MWSVDLTVLSMGRLLTTESGVMLGKDGDGGTISLTFLVSCVSVLVRYLKGS